MTRTLLLVIGGFALGLAVANVCFILDPRAASWMMTLVSIGIFAQTMAIATLITPSTGGE